MKYLITLFLVLGVIIGGLSYYKSNIISKIDSFESCVKAGNPVLESYPRQCRTSDGRFFTEDIYLHPLIKITSPSPKEVVSSPVTIKGEAKGTWYFEASFPIRLLDEDGKEIAVHYAQAEGDWMTEDFVPFSATLSFPTTTVGVGTLILQKDNPSGLPEHDDSISIPVIFSSENMISSCRITGCSGQICSDTDVVTTCEFKEEYSCYKKAICERQVGGECGWTKTTEFQACINDNPSILE